MSIKKYAERCYKTSRKLLFLISLLTISILYPLFVPRVLADSGSSGWAVTLNQNGDYTLSWTAADIANLPPLSGCVGGLHDLIFVLGTAQTPVSFDLSNANNAYGAPNSDRVALNAYHFSSNIGNSFYTNGDTHLRIAISYQDAGENCNGLLSITPDILYTSLPYTSPTTTPPSIAPIPSTVVNIGSTYTNNGSFSETGSSSWTATVDYGDGGYGVDGSGLQSLPLSGQNFTLNHVYKDAGTYKVVVRVTDDQGATGFSTATVYVNSGWAVTLNQNGDYKLSWTASDIATLPPLSGCVGGLHDLNFVLGTAQTPVSFDLSNTDTTYGAPNSDRVALNVYQFSSTIGNSFYTNGDTHLRVAISYQDSGENCHGLLAITPDILYTALPYSSPVNTPVLGTPTWSANPILVNTGNSTLTVPVTSSLFGAVAGEYFIGTDPGIGNATTMTYSSGNLTASFGSSLTAGVYTIGVRAEDAAGNWSPTTNTMLVIYDSTTTLGMTGKNKKDLVPSTANGDVMPGLVSGATDAADYGFTVQYKNGVLDTHNGFTFMYSTRGHSFSLNATGFDWMTTGSTNNSQGWFQGTATVTVDGVTTTNPFWVTGTDGGRLTPTVNDYLMLRVYSPGANPSTANPIYQASGSMASSNSVKIQ
jgi:hypothetical protein